MLDIIPSILTNNPKEAKELIAKCDGIVPRVQIDIVDGVFANNKTIYPEDLGFLGVSLGFDFHLMVEEPINWVEKCQFSGADRIIGQIEKMASQKEFINAVSQTDLRVGLAIDLDTPVGSIDSELFSMLDVVLVMSVKAGFGGQVFKESALKKVKELDAIRIEKRILFKICVDGGENENVIDDSYYDGADEIVIGRSLFNGDVSDNIKKLQDAAVRH